MKSPSKAADPHRQLCKEGVHVWNHWDGKDPQCVVCNAHHERGPSGICEEKGHWWYEDVTDPWHSVPIEYGGHLRCMRCDSFSRVTKPMMAKS